VISTRYFFPDGKDTFTCCDPAKAAREVKLRLESVSDACREQPQKVKVFNPNTDNAFIMGGHEKEANAIWLLNWRKYLDRAKETGGKVIQILVDEPSNMQEAEASMAADKGVPVLYIRMSHLKGQLIDAPSFAVEHRKSAKAFNDFLEELPSKVSQLEPQPEKSVTVTYFKRVELYVNFKM